MKKQNERIDNAGSEAVSVSTVKKSGRAGKILGRVAKYLTATIVLAVLFWFGFTYQVREGECAVVLRFGAVRTETEDAGLYMRLPWPFERVVTYDNRLITMQSNGLETTTKDNRNVLIQSYVVWQIADPVLYHNSVGAQGNAESYIKAQVTSATNSTLGSYNLSALVSLAKAEIKIDQIQNEIFTRVRENCLANYGVDVVDVSILRLSVPATNLEQVFEAIRAARETQIQEILYAAEVEAGERINEADVNASEILKKAQEEAAKHRAQAQKDVFEIYAKAQAANVDLYKFLINLDTLVNSINSSTVLVVKADQYPFNILTEYSKQMDIESEGVMINDLAYILSALPEDKRTELVNAINDLIDKAKDGVAP